MTGAGIGLFGLASLMCAVAPPIATLVAARGVQTVGWRWIFALNIPRGVPDRRR